MEAKISKTPWVRAEVGSYMQEYSMAKSLEHLKVIGIKNPYRSLALSLVFVRSVKIAMCSLLKEVLNNVVYSQPPHFIPSNY